MRLEPSPTEADPPRIVRLLDADPDLAAALSGPELADARDHAVLSAVSLPAGPMRTRQLRTAADVRGDIHGFLVVDGALTIEACLAQRPCVRLIAPRELILLGGIEMESLPVSWQLSVLVPAEVAILDQRLLVIGQRWPRLMAAILKRAAQQTRQTLLQQAISQLPRVEDRLLAFFWTIADRQGIVRSDGIFVPLPVTHRTLAHMIGARRPTVTLGLTRLAEQGLLHAHETGWLLDPASRLQFSQPDRDGRG